jgi:hypothetical protein
MMLGGHADQKSDRPDAVVGEVIAGEHDQDIGPGQAIALARLR